MDEKLSERLWRLLNDASERCALNSNELCLRDGVATRGDVDPRRPVGLGGADHH